VLELVVLVVVVPTRTGGEATGGAVATARESVADALCTEDEESETETETELVPAASGVPLIVSPVALSPAGRPLTVKVYGAVPPAALSVAE
jgi:hypothetical protein